MENNADKRAVDLKSPVVINVAELSELVHENVDPPSVCANDLRESLLRDSGNDFLRPTVFAIVGQQQQRAC